MWRFKPNNKGWECPKCGHVYSPSTVMCFYCGNDTSKIKEGSVLNEPSTTAPEGSKTVYGPCKMPPQEGKFTAGGIEGVGYKGYREK